MMNNSKKNILKAGFAIFILLFHVSGRAQVKETKSELYTAQQRVRSGIAMGGIGAGSVELRKDGQFYNWNIMNNWPMGTGEPFKLKQLPHSDGEEALLFFLVRYQQEGERPRVKLLQINNSLNEGNIQSTAYYYPWMTAVNTIRYTAKFPFTTLEFSDPDMPFEISLEAFSPFIPHDVKNSALPGAYFNFTVHSKSSKPVKIFLIASLRNLVGYDITDKYFKTQSFEGKDYKGFTMTCGGMDSMRSSFGEMGISSLSGRSSFYLGWEHKHPYYESLLVSTKFRNINDTEARTKLINGKKGNVSEGKDQRCFSSIGIDSVLLPGKSFNHSFVLTWNFPNMYGGYENEKIKEETCLDYSIPIVITKKTGHYYSNFFNSNKAVAVYLLDNQKELTHRSKEFLTDFYNSDLPEYILNQINSQLNTFVSSSTLCKSGTFGIREGMTSEKTWGPIATIDVSLYGSSSIIALFPDLQKTMMRAHKNLQTSTGEINHGLGDDMDYSQNGTWGVYDRIDLVPNYIQMVLRDYFFTNDKAYLKEMWPSIVKGIQYILTKRDNDKDLMPEMNGVMCSYDNFPMYGLASYIQTQWIAAMMSVKHAAHDMSDIETEKLATAILDKGKKLLTSKLWNGKYFDVANDYQGKKGNDNAVLTDQIIGQWMANQSNLGYMADKKMIDSALLNILRYSYQPDFGLRNCTWPKYPELFPIETSDLWVDQANTCWSGVELAFASFLLDEGFVNEAGQVIKTVDDRYRNAGIYFDHQEYGGHYYRPMSAWAIINSYLGLRFNCGTLFFNPKLNTESYTLFFSFDKGTAHYTKSNNSINIKVNTGNLTFSGMDFQNSGVKSKKPMAYLNGKQMAGISILSKNETISIKCKDELTIPSGSVLEIK